MLFSYLHAFLFFLSSKNKTYFKFISNFKRSLVLVRIHPQAKITATSKIFLVTTVKVLTHLTGISSHCHKSIDIMQRLMLYFAVSLLINVIAREASERLESLVQPYNTCDTHCSGSYAQMHLHLYFASAWGFLCLYKLFKHKQFVIKCVNEI